MREGREIRIPAACSRLSNRIDPSKERNEGFRDIAALAVAEVTEVEIATGAFPTPGSGAAEGRADATRRLPRLAAGIRERGATGRWEYMYCESVARA